MKLYTIRVEYDLYNDETFVSHETFENDVIFGNEQDAIDSVKDVFADGNHYSDLVQKNVAIQAVAKILDTRLVQQMIHSVLAKDMTATEKWDTIAALFG